MAKISKDENILSGDHRIITIWQEQEDGVPEQALSLRTYSDRLVAIRQLDSEILINPLTVPDLCLALKKLASHKPRESK